ncbi:hypothetical protein CDD82_1670 [Ophiocordyceps australis]|uniref:BZIP domain-containing protein n=1 Tax=Ophiocordyceps australis TaxID=1399860 RepID=A0A2C5ZF48_9HYPO|nr:hypothetical protein CDD82_1670 [Ophiocordyceps australis]
MDFTGHYHQHQFAGAQPYQAFISLNPMTPSHSTSHSHSHSAVSDDFHAASPGPAVFDAMATTEHFQSFDFANGFANPVHQHVAAFDPSPPSPQSTAAFTAQHHHHHQQYQRHSLPQLHHQPLARNAAPDPLASNALLEDFCQRVTKGDSADAEDTSLMNKGSDEDESLTPAQSRRKAQNRAAQRAFRERKEKHVKDLEAKLANLEAAQQQASVENERLKRDLQKISTENEILRATSAMSSGHHSSLSPEPVPMRFSSTDFYSNVLQKYPDKFPSHRVITSDDGERLMAAGATWDFIIDHDLYKRGLVDVGDVSERLKSLARCDGQGPVFSESDIIEAIEQSVASGSDDLL